VHFKNQYIDVQDFFLIYRKGQKGIWLFRLLANVFSFFGVNRTLAENQDSKANYPDLR
jgi:hypothetical protein